MRFFAHRLPTLSPNLKIFSSSLIQVPFLNLMANLLQRSGSFMVRIGGNTQETAKVTYDTLPNGRVMEKDLSGVSNPVGH